jgi:DNA modification methylase
VWDQGPGLPGDWGGRLSPAFEFIFHFNKSSIKVNKIKDTIWGGHKNHGSGLRSKNGDVKGYSHAGKEVQLKKIPDSVIRVMRHKARGIEISHPAVFPVDFAGEMILSFTDTNDLIYDPFSGSGTTIIACEQLGRRCRAVEISPAYVAVALQRWADATGKTPVLIEE